MKNHILLRTNLLVCMITTFGFLITAIISYQANYKASIENIEQVSSLSLDGIYYQLISIFSKPLNVSLAMANDSLLKERLEKEPSHKDDPDYTLTIKKYLDTYQWQYGFDSVFLVSTATSRYYNFNGLDRVLDKDDPENQWYYQLLLSPEDYSLNVDNDQVSNANNAVTIFVNCKIKNADNKVIGIIGVGLRIDDLQRLLTEYENQFQVNAYLINENGTIEISTKYTGYQNRDLFALQGLENIRSQVLGNKDGRVSQHIWVHKHGEDTNFITTRYIPQLCWHLVVEGNAWRMLGALRGQFYQTALIIFGIVATILLVISYVIRGFNKRILILTREREENFRKATEQLYDNIYELNITKNCTAGSSTKRYFESLGVPPNMPYDKALEIIAQKQIKEEFREGYISTLKPENILRQFHDGNSHLQYDFMITQEGSDYFWMRIDAHIYFCAEDNSIRMFIYRKNIDAEKKQELQMAEQVETDQMTGLYSKMATKQHIQEMLDKDKGRMHGFFIFDIDDFKQANDQHSHAFGDLVIGEFARILKLHFRKDDVLGRIGGDEFVAFIPIPNQAFATEKAKELSKALQKTCTFEAASWDMATSIGIAISPKDGTDFDTLYRNADTALYLSKNNGKNGYTFYGKNEGRT